jgi:hypothetical protein
LFQKIVHHHQPSNQLKEIPYLRKEISPVNFYIGMLWSQVLVYEFDRTIKANPYCKTAHALPILLQGSPAFKKPSIESSKQTMAY